MGGYLCDNGDLNLARAQIILEGLAKREDEIFRKRREGPSNAFNQCISCCFHMQVRNIDTCSCSRGAARPEC
ncbi:hypothetical protein FA15DRAFT_666740 [Coprinopsis marcescibilis]|uniref:Xrn1 helical domain-containing protein n=1 Tax=Coprinopsis marcescibilis TaxID=230819 RepID=A0A5C3L2F1_COPMA|nr:hypothetical protein FA15DRAFT_666740 [Coprinopsis marcescibilis]